jgi:hypothetical protein
MEGTGLASRGEGENQESSPPSLFPPAPSPISAPLRLCARPHPLPSLPGMMRHNGVKTLFLTFSIDRASLSPSRAHPHRLPFLLPIDTCCPYEGRRNSHRQDDILQPQPFLPSAPPFAGSLLHLLGRPGARARPATRPHSLFPHRLRVHRSPGGLPRYAASISGYRPRHDAGHFRPSRGGTISLDGRDHDCGPGLVASRHPRTPGAISRGHRRRPIGGERLAPQQHARSSTATNGT